MNIQDMKVSELRSYIEKTESEKAALAETMETERKTADAANKRICNLKKEVNDLEWNVNKATECLLIRSKLPKEVLKLRGELIELLTLLNSEDITKREEKEFSNRMKETRAQLQAACGHPFVAQTRDSYKGSHSYDREDSHYGERICFVCGFSERSESTHTDECETLGSDGTRLVKRDLRNDSERGWRWVSEFPLLPLSEIRKLFLRSLGSINLHWSD